MGALKKGCSARADYIPAELVQAGGKTIIDVITKICDKIWRTGEWPTPWTQSLITRPKKTTYSSARTTDPFTSAVNRARHAENHLK